MTGRLSLLLFPIFAISQCLAISQCDTKVEKNIFLWSIKNPNFSSTPQGFLFGTIHVPFAEVWSEVSDRVREAFHVSDTVLLEIDLHDEDTIHELISCKNLAFEETVHSYLPPRLFQRIDKLMKNLRTTFLTWAQTQSPKDTKKIKNAEEIYNNITGDWWKKRPIWLLFLLYQMCENVFEKTSSPLLDLYIAQRAIDEKKSIIPIETAEEQCNPVRSVSSDDIIFAIEHTVKYLEDKFLEKKSELQNSKRGLAELINHYKCGTLKEDVLVKDGMSIIDYATEELEKFRAEEINRKLKEDIFLRRNIRMAKRIDGILKALKNHTIFSAIGAGHFFGDDSVLSHLQKNGYVIEKVKETDSIRSLQNPYRQTAKFKRVWTKESIVRRKSVIIEEVEPSSCSAPNFYIVLIIATFFQLFHSIFQ